MPNDWDKASQLARQARSVVVLSGAGMSADSGVPTFRDAQSGLWERFNPEQLATEDAFRSNPSMVWTWYVWRAVLVNSVEPHIGHNYIGAWQRYLAGIEGSLTVATQNVDDLHERGGAQKVLHLHGSLHQYHCLDCHKAAAFDPAHTGIRPDQQFHRDNVLSAVDCPHCDSGLLRPGVVWFGESLPEPAFQTAIDALRKADLVVVVGSSGLVQPSASLPFLGQDAGAAVLEINPTPTELSNKADVYLGSTAAMAIPEMLAGLLT